MYEYNMENIKEFKEIPDDFDFEDDVVYQAKGTFEVKPHEIYRPNTPPPYDYEHDGNYVISFYHGGAIIGGVVPPTDNQFISQFMSGEVYFKNPKFFPVADVEVEIVAAFLQ